MHGAGGLGLWAAARLCGLAAAASEATVVRTRLRGSDGLAAEPGVASGAGAGAGAGARAGVGAGRGCGARTARLTGGAAAGIGAGSGCSANTRAAERVDKRPEGPGPEGLGPEGLARSNSSACARLSFTLAPMPWTRATWHARQKRGVTPCRLWHACGRTAPGASVVRWPRAVALRAVALQAAVPTRGRLAPPLVGVAAPESRAAPPRLGPLRRARAWLAWARRACSSPALAGGKPSTTLPLSSAHEASSSLAWRHRRRPG